MVVVQELYINECHEEEEDTLAVVGCQLYAMTMASWCPMMFLEEYVCRWFSQSMKCSHSMLENSASG